MKYEIKKLKTFKGMEGGGYNCDLYRDGIKVAEIIQSGDGGETNIQWTVKGEADKLREHTKDMYYPPELLDCKERPLKMGMDGFIEELVIQFEVNKKLARAVKTKTCFRRKGQNPGDYYTYNRMFSAEVKANLQEKYPDLEVIYNEQFGQVAL